MRRPPPALSRAVDRLQARVARRSVVAVAGLGVLMMQLAWFLAVPPFRGADEFDHAYRAAAVARGQVVAEPTDATRGTGAVVTTPRDIVEAAGPECRRLPYTEPADCRAAGEGRMVQVPSGAGRYSPVFYAIVGTAALPFEGITAFYVMRLTALALCWLLILGALLSAARLGPTSWPVVGLAVALTPVVVFSTSVMAPNGLELAAGAAFWLTLLHVLRNPATAPGRGSVALLAVSGTLLTTVRSLGPLWCLMILGCCLLAVRPSRVRLRDLATSPRLAGAALLVTTAAVASAAWTLTMGSLKVGAEDSPANTWWAKVIAVADQIFLWVLQSIATFPTRTEAAPTLVYVLEFALLASLLVLLRGAPRRYSVAVAVVTLLAVAVPFAATYATYDQHGTSWQGRYTLPFAMGLVILAATGLDASQRRLRPDLVLIGLLAYVTAQWMGAATLMQRERPFSPGVASGDWLLVPTAAVAALLGTGAAIVWLAATSRVPLDVEVDIERTSAAVGRS